jgi:hypothetical protein
MGVVGEVVDGEVAVELFKRQVVHEPDVSLLDVALEVDHAF